MISVEVMSGLNTVLSLGAILLQLFIIGSLLFLCLARESKIFHLLQQQGVLFSFGLTIFAALTSLFYSEIAGYEICSLCWYQRIFLYPQVLLLGMALRKQEEPILKSCLVLSIMGMAIAIYHTILQFADTALPCPAGSVSCSQRFFLEFGYITIPTLSLTIFAAVILLLWCTKIPRKEKTSEA